MSLARMCVMVFFMALVTYLIRVFPIAFLRKKIKSQYLRSFFYYLPFAVLSAMTFPYIFYSTGSTVTALIGTAIALVAALGNRSLITVALLASSGACIAAYLI